MCGSILASKGLIFSLSQPYDTCIDIPLLLAPLAPQFGVDIFTDQPAIESLSHLCINLIHTSQVTAKTFSGTTCNKKMKQNFSPVSPVFISVLLRHPASSVSFRCCSGRCLLGFAGFAGAATGLLCCGPTVGLMLSGMAIHVLCRDDRRKWLGVGLACGVKLVAFV